MFLAFFRHLEMLKWVQMDQMGLEEARAVNLHFIFHLLKPPPPALQIGQDECRSVRCRKQQPDFFSILALLQLKPCHQLARYFRIRVYHVP